MTQSAPRENLLDQHSASDEVAIGDAGHGDHRQKSVPQRITGDDLLRESACPGILDEVAEQSLRHGRSRHLQDGPGVDEGQGERGKSEVRQRRPERRPIAAEDAVDRIEAGHLRRRKEREIDPANRGGNDLKFSEQHEDQEQRPPKIRHGAGEHSVGRRKPIHDRSRSQSGQHAKGKRNAEGENESQRDQFKRRGQTLQDVFRHLAAGEPRFPQIPMRDAAKIDEVLVPNGKVEAHLLPD